MGVLKQFFYTDNNYRFLRKGKVLFKIWHMGEAGKTAKQKARKIHHKFL
jgi:hypothetical protein